jgi:HK97 family phage portal protein
MLFRRSEQRNTTYTLSDIEMAKWLGIEVDGVSADKAKEACFYSCLRILSDTLGKLPVKLYQDTSEGNVTAPNHYLYSLLKHRPNPYMSSQNFFKAVEFQRNYYGFSIVYIDTAKKGRNAGKVLGLYPLDSSKIEIWVDDKGLIGKDNSLWFIYKPDNQAEIKIPHTQALSFLAMTSDGITGMAVKDYLHTVVENAQSGQQYVNNYFKGGLMAKGVLQFTGDISPDNLSMMQARFEKMSNGIKNAGKILPMPLGFSFQPINTTLADNQFLELNQLSIRQIASAFGIKGFQINDLDRATHSNIEHQNRSFYVDTLLAILTQYESEITYKLLTEKEREQGYHFRFYVDIILRGDFKSQIEALGKAVDSGLYTPNEGRKKLDLPSQEGGDKLIVNGNFIPITMVGQQYLKKDSSVKGGVEE